MMLPIMRRGLTIGVKGANPVTGSRPPPASRIVGIGEAVENTRTGEYPDETTHNSIYWYAIVAAAVVGYFYYQRTRSDITIQVPKVELKR